MRIFTPFTGALSLLLFSVLATSVPGRPVADSTQTVLSSHGPRKNASVLILGGGVAGTAAAVALQESGVSDFIILEARHELGGRLMSRSFGAAPREYTLELGANWIQGTHSKGGLENPIWTLSKKHDIATSVSSFGNISTPFINVQPIHVILVNRRAQPHMTRLALWISAMR